MIDPTAAPDFQWWERPTWHQHALCRGTMHNGVNDWFPTEERSGRRTTTWQQDALQRAQQLCAACPVARQCAETGASQRYGTWAGHNRNLKPRRHHAA